MFFVAISVAPPNVSNMSIGKTILERRKALGLSGRELARAADISAAQISRVESGDRILTRTVAHAIAPHLGLDALALLAEQERQERERSTQALNKIASPQYMPPSQQNLVPVYGQASCGPDGQFEMNGQIVDHQRRPWSLETVPEAYALYVEGTSMHPRFKEGEIVYVHPGRKPRIEDDVVVQLHPLQDGEPPRAFIKEYRGGDLAAITLRQYGDDPKDFTIQRDEILSIHKIVGRGEPA